MDARRAIFKRAGVHERHVDVSPQQEITARRDDERCGGISSGKIGRTLRQQQSWRGSSEVGETAASTKET